MKSSRRQRTFFHSFFILQTTLLGLLSGCITKTNNNDDAGTQRTPVELAEVHFKITFDYRFDEDEFFTAPKKAVLEEAANAWGRLLFNDFPSIPAGTPLLVRDPQRPNEDAQRIELDDQIDDFIIFVGASSLDGFGGVQARSFPTATFDINDDVLSADLRERIEGNSFQPWSGWLTFDKDEVWFVDATPTTDDDVDGQVPDLFTNAMHEIGHLLGVGTSDAFFAYIENDLFTGPASVDVFGEPVPVTATGQHLQDGFLVNAQEPLMNRTDSDGSRHRPTALDLALLKDIGFQLQSETP